MRIQIILTHNERICSISTYHIKVKTWKLVENVNWMCKIQVKTNKLFRAAWLKKYSRLSKPLIPSRGMLNFPRFDNVQRLCIHNECEKLNSLFVSKLHWKLCVPTNNILYFKAGKQILTTFKLNKLSITLSIKFYIQWQLFYTLP